MKTIKELAEELAKDLLDDLNGRSGFDTGNVDDEIIQEWEEEWQAFITQAIKEREKGLVETLRFYGDPANISFNEEDDVIEDDGGDDWNDIGTKAQTTLKEYGYGEE